MTRFINDTEMSCGCRVAFDTLFWRPRALEVCMLHKGMMISIALGACPFGLVEEGEEIRHA